MTETNIPMLVTIVTMRALIISETWSPEDTCHHEGRGVISSHHGPLVIYLFFNFIYFSIMIQISMMRWSLDINVLERSVQCFLFNRALQVF